MNNKRYRWILYTIIVVIAATISIQVYWNYKNYQTNKQQLINDVQVSLDKAVDDYYAALAERTTFGFILEGDQQKNAFEEGSELEKFFKTIDESKNEFTNLDSLDKNTIEGITVFRGFKADSMSEAHNKKHNPLSAEQFKLKIDSLKNNNKDVNLKNAEFLTSKVMISIKNDTLDVKAVEELIAKELERKSINVDFYLDYKDIERDVNYFKVNGSLPELDPNHMSDDYLQTDTKSRFLPKGTFLTILFTNTTKTILYRILGGILISTLLVLAVISSLFYLLKIIKHQKQLAEVKNDLISNITHEFKTPIATISAAIESISNFNGIDDKEKTKKYLNMSSTQLGKLNVMVEKLLETATLDSNNLDLNKENFDITSLLDALVSKYKIQFPKKTFNSNIQLKSLIVNADIFHVENALNNILDNAVKYGGAIITTELKTKKNSFDILISDNGNSLNNENKNQIFDKFYRVPKGNTHDVKGFGIGLYYTKTIIEKHNGSIALDLNKNLTTFKITLPND
ncbi:HAMP domain-containing histidine kinase [Winogradskyella undariae]|uniref:sensor histidine kinase n=1 Tax=Winogradskyella undariae TaxID=1285465 RepID=UPI00156B0D12|nr:HAMP domain-containing sensor histidine kinase [Winogradskyella undariae]NRR90282.1 HAMP domain-containing histidine kinase [Winogradskyella undariae]